MFPNPKDRKLNTRQFQEAATQRKASNDTQYFWDLVNRHNAGHNVGPNRKPSKAQEEHHLFTKKAEETSASTGIIDDNIPVQRSGPRADEVNALESFEELRDNVPSSITGCLERLKFDKPTPIQKHAVPLGLAGLDLMCCAQTGSGKTLAFLIPVITALSKFSEGQMGPPPIDGRGALPKAIVLAPTRELASQIHLDARRLTFGSSARSVCVYGGNDIRNQLVELCLGCDVIVATPGRLNDLVERGIVSLSQVNFLVLDEADRMLDMGFEPQIRRIVLEYDMPRGENRQTFMFSATFPNEIQALAREFLQNYVWIAVGRVGSTVENIKQQVLLSSPDPSEKVQLLLNVLEQTEGRTLIFVQKKRTASWLCDTLRNRFQVSAEEIHGDRSQAQRENALKLFRDGHIRILVATDVAARGLDVPLVTHVIQFDMPLSPEDFDVYVHRIGRTGRAGQSGLATSFFVPGRDIGEGNGKIAPHLLRLLKENSQEIPDWFANLDDVHGGHHHHGMQRKSNHPQQRMQSNRFGYQDSRSNQRNILYQPNPSENRFQPPVLTNPLAPQFSSGGVEGLNGNSFHQGRGAGLLQRPPHSMNGGAQQRMPNSNSFNQQFYQGYNQPQVGNASVPPYSQQLPTPPPLHPAAPAAHASFPVPTGPGSLNSSFATSGYYDPYSGTYVPGNSNVPGLEPNSAYGAPSASPATTVPQGAQQNWSMGNNMNAVPKGMPAMNLNVPVAGGDMDRSGRNSGNYGPRAMNSDYSRQMNARPQMQGKPYQSNFSPEQSNFQQDRGYMMQQQQQHQQQQRPYYNSGMHPNTMNAGYQQPHMIPQQPQGPNVSAGNNNFIPRMDNRVAAQPGFRDYGYGASQGMHAYPGNNKFPQGQPYQQYIVPDNGHYSAGDSMENNDRDGGESLQKYQVSGDDVEPSAES